MSDRSLIHVVDDDESLRTALLRLLTAAGFDARGYDSAGAFLLAPPPNRPGCILLDLRLPGPSGLDLQAHLRQHGIELPVVFMSGHADLAAGVRAMKAGAVDFLEKPVRRAALLEAIARALALGVSDQAARDDADRLRARFAALSPREREVFDRVAAGLLNKQIAAALGVSERTVKAQRAQLMAKLGVESPAELGVLAERLRRLPG